MARVTCPQCGTKRVVVEGKRKNCRKCGTRLTANMANIKNAVRTPKGEEQPAKA